MTSRDFSREWLNIPAAQSLLDEIEQELRLGLNHCVIFPNGSDIQDVIEQLSARLWSVGVFCESLDLEPYSDIVPPDVLNRVCIHSSAENAISTEALVTHQDMPEVLLLSGFEFLSPPIKKAWISFLHQWAETARRQECERSICLLSTAFDWNEIGLPPSALRLKIQFWHNIPSRLEAQGIYRQAIQNIDADTLWREAIVTSLAGGDFALGNHLWKIVDGEFDQITRALCTYAEDQQWTRSIFADNLWDNWHPGPPGSHALAPETPSFHLWSRGWIVHTPEYGEEIHSALVALKGDKTELNYRLWRAQAPLILPLIEKIRLTVCRYLTRQYNADWPRLADQEPTDGLEELGKLEIVLRHSSRLYWEREQWLEAILLSRNLRNQLAHYATIAYENFVQLWKYSQKIHQIKYTALRL